jgi:hypothetical protein
VLAISGANVTRGKYNRGLPCASSDRNKTRAVRDCGTARSGRDGRAVNHCRRKVFDEFVTFAKHLRRAQHAAPLRNGLVGRGRGLVC